MTLDRILQSQGFGSRRQCAQRIWAGEIKVDGVVCDDPRADFAPDGRILTVDSVDWLYRPHAYVALHKPAGFECSQKPQHHPSVLTLLPPELRLRGVQCIGRLDQDTTGLLLLSDDGQFIHRYSSSRRKVPKLYEVQTAEPVTAAQVSHLLNGVSLDDEPEPVSAQDCEQVGSHQLRLTLSQGKYHQVKRMVAAAGNHVAALHRSRLGGFDLPASLPEGEWMWLEANHLEELANDSAQQSVDSTV
jgi:16S rRNA pseudouridine516 synthase